MGGYLYLSDHVREFNLLSGLDHECIVKYYDLIETNYPEITHGKPSTPSSTTSPSPSPTASPTNSAKSSLSSYSSAGVQDGKFYLVMEWLGDGCNLTSWIRNNAQRSFESIRCILKKLFEAMEYLAVKEIAHHDIKLDNIIFNEESSSLKLIDFGVSEHCPGDESYCSFGTPAYQAPEILTRSDPSKPVSGHKSDMWSIGIVAYQLIHPDGLLPFGGDSVMEVFDSIINCKPDLSMISDRSLKDLIVKLLDKNPKNRINAAEALFHPFITGKKSSFLDEIISKIKSIFN